jgi:hypothetical protein
MGKRIMPKPAAKPAVTTDSLNRGPGSRLRWSIGRGYGRFGGFLESAARLAIRRPAHERDPETDDTHYMHRMSIPSSPMTRRSTRAWPGVSYSAQGATPTTRSAARLSGRLTVS